MTSGPFGQRLAEKLLSELRGAPGITGKIRYAARHWQQIQSLSKDERERVALTLGSQQGSRLLEKFFARDGELSADEEAVQRAFERLGDADPGDLREVASSLRSGDFDKLRRDLVKSVAVPAAAPAAVLVTEVPPTPAAVIPDLEEGAEPVLLELDAGDAEVEPAESVEPAEPVESVETPPPAADDEIDSLDLLREDAEEEIGGFDQAEDSDGPVEERLSFPARDSEERPSASQRLALLRGLHSGAITLPTRADRVDFLERLESGWAVRRGLSSLIRSHRLTDLDEALDLLARIDSAAQRSWCLFDLVEHWDLDPAAIDRVLAAAPSAAARRRLRRRAAS